MELKMYKNVDGDVRVSITFDTDEERATVISATSLVGEPASLKVVCQSIYRNQGEFYRDYGIDDSHLGTFHPDDYNFSTGCDGWRKFLYSEFGTDKIQRLNSTQMQKITDTLAKRISYLVNLSNNSDIALSSITILPEETVKIEDPLLFDKSLVVTDDGVYRVNFRKLKRPGLKELFGDMAEQVKTAYQRQVDAKYETHQKILEKLRKTNEELVAKSFIRGITVYNDIQSKGWKLEKINEQNFLKRSKVIYPSVIKNNGILYNIPQELRKTFHVNSLRIRVEDPVHDAFCLEKSFHPNVDSAGLVCMGDLAHKPLLEVIEKLPKAMQTVNLDSAYEGGATEEAYDLLRSGEAKKGGKIWTME